MSYVTQNQPPGTPAWIDLGIPDLERAMAFYGGVFGWTFEVGPVEYGSYTTCFLAGRRAAALMANPAAGEVWWNVYLATDDVDATVAAARAAGGQVLTDPMDVMDQGRMALVRDPVGAQFGLWQGRAHIGCEVVNEPGALVRNDLQTSNPRAARAFYPAVFGFTLDGNDDLEGVDFTFLRRPDGHEVGGIVGDPGRTRSAWNTTFAVADTDLTAATIAGLGGSVTVPPHDMPYARLGTALDPFGAEFSFGAPRGGLGGTAALDPVARQGAGKARPRPVTPTGTRSP
ncbi:MAG TPA: VOC family protein [Dermatophilaceae bacterium]|nr:VOC family protein [Dermatophilaceae bacterium]